MSRADDIVRQLQTLTADSSDLLTATKAMLVLESWRLYNPTFAYYFRGAVGGFSAELDSGHESDCYLWDTSDRRTVVDFVTFLLDFEEHANRQAKLRLSLNAATMN